MSVSHIQPRRRAASPQTQTTLANPTSCPADRGLTLNLKKGATFHSPTSPSSSSTDPILDIRSLPARQPTSTKGLEHLLSPSSPKAIESLVHDSEERIQQLLDRFDRSISLGSDPDDLGDKNSLPVPGFFVEHAADAHSDPATLRPKDGKGEAGYLDGVEPDHSHESDSGLGSSVSSVETIAANVRTGHEVRSTSSVYSAHTNSTVGVNEAATPRASPSRKLSDHAIKQIHTHIVEPLLEEAKLKEFHPLVKDIPRRIGDRAITCLRDLEKTLLFLAPVSVDLSAGDGILAYCFLLHTKTKSSSPKSYLQFCETSIQCIHTTVEHLNDREQRRPTDRPYTNNYFVDLVEQVRQYARIMAISRQKKAAGQKLSKKDYEPGEQLRLVGGPSEDRPAELVREKQDGEIISIDGAEVAVDEDEDMVDDDVQRSMARKRKCDIGKVEYRACRECGKVFTRPCDLTKHEKTHSRPWKCPKDDCKYNSLGWPTEKERDRHVNDKHSSMPAMFKCLFPPCAYTSKRESNCKQHMEKAHGWEYVRSKSKKGQQLVPSKSSPLTPLMPTPAHISTPVSTSSSINSPLNQASTDFDSMHESTPELVPGSNYSPSWDGSGFNPSPQDAFSMNDPITNQNFSFNNFGDGYQWNGGLFSPKPSEARNVGTPGTGFSGSPLNNPEPSITFEDTFNFNELNNNNPWPPMADYFPQYNIQQPTPAFSDECDFTFGDAHQQGRPNEFLATSPNDVAFPNLADDNEESLYAIPRNGNSQVNDDFTLFGEMGTAGGETSAAGGAMFPDLNDVGRQMGYDPMFDPMSDVHFDAYN